MDSPHPKLNNSPENHAPWDRRVIWLICGMLLVRVIYTAIVPLDLCPDEAYYWDWSRQLDWGYYSKPPMVAWLIGVSTRLLGDSPFAVRLPAALLTTFGVIPLYLLGRRMYGGKVSFWSVLAASLTPGSAAMGFLMTIDAPLLFCWAGMLYCVWRMLENEALSWRWLGGATLFCGLGLLSKQTMVTAIALVWMFVVISPSDRVHLKRPSIWLWTIGSLMFLTPVLAWNSQHEWITFQHTSEHFQLQSVAISRQFVRVLEFCAGQFGVVSPLACGIPLLAVFGGRAAFRGADRRVLFLGTLSVLPLIGVLLLSVTLRVQPNWPAPFYPAAFVLTTAWAFGRVPIAERIYVMKSTYTPAVACGAFGAVLVYLIPFLVPAVGLQGSRIDVTARLQGWQELGERTTEVVAGLGLKSPPGFVAVCERNPISPLAFYTVGQPQVHRWTASRVIECQHDIWQKPDFNQFDDLIVITRGGAGVPNALKGGNRAVEFCERVTIDLGNSRRRRFDLWHLSRRAEDDVARLSSEFHR